MATAQVLLEKGRRINEIEETVEDIFMKELSKINKFCVELSKGVYPVC